MFKRCLLPVDESVFRRLYSLQIVLSNALPHPAATNPRQVSTIHVILFMVVPLDAAKECPE